MNKPSPSSVTVEEAVARMVNMDYIPTGLSVVEMTAAFLEEAEVDHYNATKVDPLPADQIAALQLRVDACKARLSLTLLLLDDIKQEIGKGEDSMIVLSDDATSQRRLDLGTVSNWAAYKYGIGIPEWSVAGYGTDKTNGSAKDIRWEDVKIKIYANNKITCFSERTGTKGKVMSFQDIGLLDKRKNMPNILGGILIGLSGKKKFPSGRKLENKHAAAISKLRTSLKLLTDISSDPFYFNKGDGYTPRFTLIDDRRNADDRAKAESQSVEFDDTRYHDSATQDYQAVNDDPDDAATNDWLANNA